jgi:hypothetical protein
LRVVCRIDVASNLVDVAMQFDGATPLVVTTLH